MPIVIPKDLPAHDILQSENIFVMSKVRAATQDIRPIKIAIVNLMPTKIETETQLMRLLSNSPLQVEVTLIRTASYESTHVKANHLEKFYKSIDCLTDEWFDGMIITGAPVETIPFEEVKYWKELQAIMDYAAKRVTSTLFICWGAQAGLYHYYGIDKKPRASKLFGIYPQYSHRMDPLLKGVDDIFYIPMSRHTEVAEADLVNNPDLEVVARSTDPDCGISILKSKNGKRFFFFGHSEYDKDTLKNEYLRDINKGLDIAKPVNYFINDRLDVNVTWRSTANIIFYNWLNYYVYQVTPFNFDN